MKITIHMGTSDNKKTFKFNKSINIQTILKKLKLDPDTVIILKNKIPIPITTELKTEQDLTIINIKSGG